jgi:hypothetical protein
MLDAVGHNDQIALRTTGLPQALRVDRTWLPSVKRMVVPGS